MNDNIRGAVHFPERNLQHTDWSGVRYGCITPTDIDGLIEYHNEVFIFYEIKTNGVKLPEGQKRALVNIVDALKSAGKVAVLFKCEHNTDVHEQIDAANTIVTGIYLGNGSWRLGCGRTLKRETDDFLRYTPIMFRTGEQPEWR